MSQSFKDYHLQPYLQSALANLQFKEPTKIQSRIMPLIARGKSVVGRSVTGSGKTHAFLLPIFNKLNPDNHSAQVLITSPSRELAYQLYENAKQLASFSSKPISVAQYIGGTDKQHQLDQLHHHQPQVIIGTPGRINDLQKSGLLNLHTVNQLVIDEADMTLDLGFLPQIDQITNNLNKNLQMMVFSATIPQQLQPFLKKYMHNPEIVEIQQKKDSNVNANIENLLVNTKGKDNNEVIYQLLTMGSPYLALVFANTRRRNEEITNYLKDKGLKVASIHGGLQARERKRVMKQIHNLDYQFVVATDLAARGIDIDGVSDVINDEIPHDLDYFVHRIGRTGRNGMKGRSLTLYQPGQEQIIKKLEKLGLSFSQKKIANNELVNDAPRKKIVKHPNNQAVYNLYAHGTMKKHKVKPGYKKKIKRSIDQHLQREQRLKVRNYKRNQRREARSQHSR